MKEDDDYGTGKNRTQSGKPRQGEGSANHNPREGEIRLGSGQGAATQKEESTKETSRVRLNLGAGEKPLKKFINADLRLLETTDIVCDVRHLPFKESIFNFILGEDILEHLSRYECIPALREWHRVLVAGGKISIKVPNLQTIAMRLMSRAIDGYEAARLIYAQQDYPENLHKNGFTPDSLIRELQTAQFKGITVTSLTGNDMNNMEAVASK